MQIHTLHPSIKRRRARRIGRGGKRGTYSGRGIKGQKSRAGARIRPALRDYIKQLPKRKGYRFSGRRTGRKPAIISVGELDKYFSAKDRVTPKTILDAGLIEWKKERAPQVKILGNGDIKKPLHIASCLVSQKARSKIEAAGGKVEP